MAQGPEQELAQRRLLLAFGANLPSGGRDPAQIVEFAMGRVVADLAPRGANWRASALYETPAFPQGSGPDYVNAALTLDCRLSSDIVLDYLHRLEARAGRSRGERWSGRTLDIDMLGYGDLVLPGAGEQTRWREMPLEAQARTAPDRLILPHPRLQDRAFVLVPLAEVAPTWTHPVTGRTTAQMLAALPADDLAAVRRIG